MGTKTENYTGRDCTGSNGTINRTLTIGNSSKTNNNNFQVFVNNSFLHLNVDYTVSHKDSNTVITFLNHVWNDQVISVIYEPLVSVIGSLVSEDYNGSDCTGSDGDLNRNLTISNTISASRPFVHPPLSPSQYICQMQQICRVAR